MKQTIGNKSIEIREITNDLDYISKIWEAERALPRWFRDASDVWTPSFESFVQFYLNNSEIYGLFVHNSLSAVVYLEIEGSSTNIHVSVIGKIEHNLITDFFTALLKKKRTEGINDFRAWLYEKNKGMIQLAMAVGFIKTGLKFYKGLTSGGSAIRWIEFVTR